MSYSVKKCGIRLDPPSLLLVYVDAKSQKRRGRTIPLKELKGDSDLQEVADDLKSHPQHNELLKSIPKRQLVRLLSIIQQYVNGHSLAESIRAVKSEESIDPEEDLNKVDESTLKKRKEVMEEAFERHQKKPGDPGFEYDKQIEFKEGEIETNEWDSGGDEDEQGF